MPGNTYYWNSAEFDSDESINNTIQRTPYVDPWDLENYAYIRDRLDSLEVSSESSSFGEPVEASSFYYAPLKNEKFLSPADKKHFDSLIESEYGTAKYAEIEEIYGEEIQQQTIESGKDFEGLYGDRRLGLNYEEETPYGSKNKRSSSTTAHDHLHHQPRTTVKRRMSYSFGDRGRSYPPQPVYHTTDDKDKSQPAPIVKERFQPNFSLSNYGHLKIDYSCSWDDLNKYISN